MVPALCEARVTCLISKRDIRASTVSSHTDTLWLMGTGVDPPNPGLREISQERSIVDAGVEYLIASRDIG